MNWWFSVGVPVLVAFLTVLASEPVKMWLYRNKHVDQRRYEVQVDRIPKLVEALGWVGSACELGSGTGWFKEDAKPFDYVDLAGRKIIEAINLGVASAYLFPANWKTEISTTAEELRGVYNEVITEKNYGGQGGARLDKPNPTISSLLQKTVGISDKQRERLQTRYRILLGLDTPERFSVWRLLALPRSVRHDS